MFFAKLRSLLLVLVAAALMQAGSQSWAYSLSGYHWPDGTQIMMHLGLSRPQVPLQDGFATWNDSAADALSIWNSYVPKVTFVATDATTPASRDGVNSVAFSNDVYGDSWGTNVLAVTLYFYSGSIFSEGDVLFNSHYNWNSYRGPLEHNGVTTTYDLHRVALHEFGHVLGLDHPDEHGQSIEAIMNSIISDLDHLADDDIAGGRSLYGFKITSNLFQQQGTSGNQFSYQIKADSQPTSYSASGLPPELQVNTSTGLISGRCYTTGTFQVTIEADDPRGPAIGKFTLFVAPQGITSPFGASIVIGDSLSYRITAANNPTSFTATNLPAGLNFDPTTGVISGTPTVSGNFAVTVTAVGPTAIAGGTISVSILPPQITSPLPFSSLEIGDVFTYRITATNNPTSFSATGLPAEFQIDTATGLITGTAMKPGFYSVTVKAQTAFGEARGTFGISILSPHLTSATFVGGQVGAVFNYQTTASNHPTSFSSGPLPPGLQLNPATGEITGTPTLSGSFSIQLTAHGEVGDAKGSISLNVTSVASYTPPIASLGPVAIGAVLADPHRARLYVAHQNGFQILDANSLAVIKSVSFLNGTTGIDISADGSTLYFTEPFYSGIKRVNLETLDNLADLHVPGHAPSAVVAGADGYFYITDVNVNGFVYQIDPQTGAEVSSFNLISRPTYTTLTIKPTPDHKSIFVAELNRISPTLAKYTLSGGAAPALTQKIDAFTPGSISSIAVSPDGSRVVAITRNFGPSKPDPTIIRSVGDLNTTLGSIPAPLQPEEIIFSFDGVYLAQTYSGSNRIDTIRLATGAIERTNTVQIGPVASVVFSRPNIAIDNTNSRVFVLAGGDLSRENIYQYPLHGPAVPPKTLMNVSTRLRTQTGDNVLIGGFIIEGAAAKSVVVRAIGPSLKAYGVTAPLTDPTLELYGADGHLVTKVDNWNEHRLDVLSSNLPPADEHEAALVATLDPGAYTTIVRGVNDTTGVALVEVFDLDPSIGSRISNISTRGKVETGDNVMIGGFIIGGDQPTKVIVRAIGPSLAQYGVPGTLADPMLALYDANGTPLASNDNWASDQGQDISDSGKAPADSHESALLRTLTPGAYTAIVSGKDGATGVALVEIYNLESPAN